MKFNADEGNQFNEPLEITIDGNDYVIDSITIDMLDEVEKISKAMQEGEIKSTEAVKMQLATLLGTESSSFDKTDIRKLSSTVKFIMNSTMGDKNPNS